MEWRGDDGKLQQLLQLLDMAGSPHNHVQQQVMASLNEFSKLQDFDMYLVTVFARMPEQQEVVRQRAGLLLKTNVGRGLDSSRLPPNAVEYVQTHAITALRDPSRAIRHTAGTVITTVVTKVGVQACTPTLNKLTEMLRDPDPNVVEGAFSALSKITEDGVQLLKQLWEAPEEYTKPFVDFCAQRLLPVFFEYAQPSAPVFARQNAIECLNHFSLNYLMNDGGYAAFRPFASRYMEVLGNLANDSDVTVLKDVCKGFVYVFENSWPELTPAHTQVVLDFMLRASKHPEYQVRLEALEIWTPCTNWSVTINMMKPMLPELVPTLLDNMVYSTADYMAMEPSMVADDNASVPDTLEDIKPRIHRETGDDDDDGDGRQGGGTWGAEWTVRKAAASSLDNLANAYKHQILPVVLPLIEAKLQHDTWEVQESGVLALGAIAMGCMESLAQFLPKVMQLLLTLCQGSKPLLRSISCWCTSRFARWICHEGNPERDAILRQVLSALLQRTLDRNKRVQEAAISAFATLEEEARHLLVPYLSDIVRTLVECFRSYQAKNLLILYDAVGTLAHSVGGDLDRPEHVQALLAPLSVKFEGVPDNDRSIVALFECLSALVQNLGESLLPILPQVIERCVRLVVNGARAAQLWQQNPNEFEKPDREVMSASIDLLSGIVEGLGEKTKEIVVTHNFTVVIPECLKDSALQVKQSAFALMGDCAKNCIEALRPHLQELLPLCAKGLRDSQSASVSNNAAWAIGEVCMKVGPEFMAPHIEEVTGALVAALQKAQGQQHLLAQNVCITLGRLGLVCAPQMASTFGTFARPWCLIMKNVRLDHEKVNAFQGLCAMIKANPQACLPFLPDLMAAIASFFPAPPVLEPSFREILTTYKAMVGPHWPTVYGQFPDDLRQRLNRLYGIGPDA